jgi:hypothetical protein
VPGKHVYNPAKGEMTVEQYMEKCLEEFEIRYEKFKRRKGINFPKSE